MIMTVKTKLNTYKINSVKNPDRLTYKQKDRPIEQLYVYKFYSKNALRSQIVLPLDIRFIRSFIKYIMKEKLSRKRQGWHYPKIAKNKQNYSETAIEWILIGHANLNKTFQPSTSNSNKAITISFLSKHNRWTKGQSELYIFYSDSQW